MSAAKVDYWFDFGRGGWFPLSIFYTFQLCTQHPTQTRHSTNTMR